MLQGKTKFYNQLGSGSLKVDGASGAEAGENLIKGTSEGFWQGSIPAIWTIKLKEHYADSKVAGDAPAVLLWLAETERGIWGLGYWIDCLITFLFVAGICICYCGAALLSLAR